MFRESNRSTKLFVFYVLVTGHWLLTTSCLASANIKEIVLVGSTPGDPAVKTMLAIAQASSVDFIKWELNLESDGDNSNTFLLKINYGVAKQGTPGFIGDGERLTLKGKYTILKNNKQEIFRMQTDRQTIISMLRLDENLFHILSPDNKLMVGNGGQSYVLSRKEPVKSSGLPVFSTSKDMASHAPATVVYEGRTPAQPIAGEHPEFKSDPTNFKIKWRLVLNRDAGNKPATYTLLKVVNNEPGEVSGKWKIIKGIISNPDAIIYQLDPDKPGESISFLVGDENILYILSKSNMLYVGNADFSFVLNRKSAK